MKHQSSKQKLYSLAPPLCQVKGRAEPNKPMQAAAPVDKDWKPAMHRARSERKRKAKLKRLDAQRQEGQATVLGLEKQLIALEKAMNKPRPQTKIKKVSWLRPNIPSPPTWKSEPN